MRLLHTADWHVGKRLKGESRLAEHEAVLAEIVALADGERVDAVIVAGDLFESAAPPPDAQALVWRTLMDLRDTGAHVVVIAGNHDNPAAIEALRPFTTPLGIVTAGHVRPVADGGVAELTTRSGESLRVALLPFLSQRWVVKAAELMAPGAAASDYALAYAGRMAQLCGHLATAFRPDAVNVITSHCFVRGGTAGGGEREAQNVEDYWVDAAAFPGSTHYVALGHLHRTQQIAGGCPIWYPGSPIQVDFGEERDTKHVLLVDATPTIPAAVTPHRLTSGWRLATVAGTLDELEAQAAGGILDDAWLRVIVREPARAGLADTVRRLFPRAVEIRLEHLAPAEDGNGTTRPSRRGRGATELFGEFMAEQGVDDDDVRALFAELYHDATTGDAA